LIKEWLPYKFTNDEKLHMEAELISQ